MSSIRFRAEKVGWMAVLKIRSGPSVNFKNQILLVQGQPTLSVQSNLALRDSNMQVKFGLKVVL